MSRYFKYFKKIKTYAFRSLAFVLAAALALTASCFSSGLVAHAAAGYTTSTHNISDGFNLIYNSSGSNLSPTEIASGVSSNRKFFTCVYDFNPVYQFLYNSPYYGHSIVGYHMLQFSVDVSSSSSLYELYYTPFNTSIDGVTYQCTISGNTITYISLFDGFSVQPTPRGESLVSGSSGFIINGQMAAASGDLSMLQVSTTFITGTSGFSISDSSASLPGLISSGINNSDISTAVALLTSISGDTALLSQVLSGIDNLNGLLANIYSEVQAGNASLNTLISALAGIDVSGLSLSAIQAAMYNNWVNIIRDAINENAPDVSGVGDQQQSANEQLATNDQLESQAFGFADNNISAIDFNVAFPGSVASSAVVVMSWLSLIWEKLGNLQFLVSATCLAGLLTIVLGVVNKFVRSSKRD